MLPLCLRSELTADAWTDTGAQLQDHGVPELGCQERGRGPPLGAHASCCHHGWSIGLYAVYSIEIHELHSASATRRTKEQVAQIHGSTGADRRFNPGKPGFRVFHREARSTRRGTAGWRRSVSRLIHRCPHHRRTSTGTANRERSFSIASRLQLMLLLPTRKLAKLFLKAQSQRLSHSPYMELLTCGTPLRNRCIPANTSSTPWRSSFSRMGFWISSLIFTKLSLFR